MDKKRPAAGLLILKPSCRSDCTLSLALFLRRSHSQEDKQADQCYEQKGHDADEPPRREEFHVCDPFLTKAGKQRLNTMPSSFRVADTRVRQGGLCRKEGRQKCSTYVFVGLQAPI